MSFEKPNHTQVPNLFFELMSDMSDVELRVTLHAIRKTFGWHKKRDAISLTQFQDATGLSRQGVLNGIGEAEKRGTIKKAGTGERNTTIYELVVEDEPKNVIPLDQSTQLTTTSQDSRPEPVNAVDTQKKEKKKKETIYSKPKEIDSEVTSRLGQIVGMTGDLFDFVKAQYADYPKQKWIEAIDSIIEQQKKQKIRSIKRYLLTILETDLEKEKHIEANTPTIPSHKPMQLDTSPGMSETERQEALEALRKVKEKIAG